MFQALTILLLMLSPISRFHQLVPGAATNLDTIHAWLIELLSESSATTNL